jgi:hypothetical protein
MVPGRTHQRKALLTAKGQINGPNGRSGGAQGVFLNTGIIGCITVEIESLPQSLQMFRVVDSENFLSRG